jgi:uncharacterized protein
MTNKEIADAYTILRIPTGSELYGLSNPGANDKDEMGICIEPISAFAGFNEFEQYIYRDAAIRTGHQDAPSEPGDLDLTIYGLRKFLRLALNGNPQIIQCFYVPHNQHIRCDASGHQLQELAPLVISRLSGKRFLGYMEAQRQRLLGERGQKKTNRPELEEKYGFDTKYAMHILRLGFQGVELLSTGRLTLPLPENDRKFCFATRNGEVPLQDVLNKAGELERELKDLLDTSPLPEQPDREAVEKWMINKYFYNWKAQEPRGGLGEKGLENA